MPIIFAESLLLLTFVWIWLVFLDCQLIVVTFFQPASQFWPVLASFSPVCRCSLVLSTTVVPWLCRALRKRCWWNSGACKCPSWKYESINQLGDTCLEWVGCKQRYCWCTTRRSCSGYYSTAGDALCQSSLLDGQICVGSLQKGWKGVPAQVLILLGMLH